MHRGAPDDTAVLGGDEIEDLTQMFFHTGEKQVPYHRIFRITYDGETVFSRPDAAPDVDG